MENIQFEVQKIHSKFGTTEMANYKIQLLAEQYAKEYHERELKKLRVADVISQRELLLDFAEYSANDKKSTAIDECVDNYLDSIKQ